MLQASGSRLSPDGTRKAGYTWIFQVWKFNLKYGDYLFKGLSEKARSFQSSFICYAYMVKSKYIVLGKTCSSPASSCPTQRSRKRATSHRWPGVGHAVEGVFGQPTLWVDDSGTHGLMCSLGSDLLMLNPRADSQLGQACK